MVEEILQEKTCPIPLKVIAENIPVELKKYNHWMLWHYDWKERTQKWDKVPYDPNVFEDPTLPLWHKKGDGTDPAKWSSFDHVMRLYHKYPKHADGVGFGLGGKVVAVDVDNCFDKDGKPVDERAAQFLALFNSYAERSASGLGLRIMMNGKLRADKKGGDCEIYSHARYVTITGHKIGQINGLVDMQPSIDMVMDRYFPQKPKPKTVRKTNNNSEIVLEDELIHKYLSNNSEKYQALYSGDEAFLTAKYPRSDGTWDHSAADLAMCGILADCTDDVDQIARMVAASALGREKWERADYQRSTIELALEGDHTEAARYFADWLVKMAGFQVDDVCQPFDIPKPSTNGNGSAHAGDPSGTAKPADQPQPSAAQEPPCEGQHDQAESNAGPKPAAKPFDQAEYDAMLNAAEANIKPKIRIYSRSDLENLPDPEWLIDQHIEEGCVGILYGGYGTCKTFWALDAALSIANNLPLFGEYKVKPGAVCYSAGEGKGNIKKRLRAWEAEHGTGLTPNTRFAFIGDIFSLVDNGHIQTAIDVIRGQLNTDKIQMVVIDTLARFCGDADENSTKEMNKFVNGCDLISKTLDCAVLIVHHTRKDGNAMRGAVCLPGACEFIIEMSSGHGLVKVRCEKAKDADEFQTYLLDKKKVLTSLVLTYQGLAKTVGNEAIEPKFYPMLKWLDIPRTAAEIAELSGLEKTRLSRLVNEAVTLELVTKEDVKRNAKITIAEKGQEIVNAHNGRELVS